MEQFYLAINSVCRTVAQASHVMVVKSHVRCKRLFYNCRSIKSNFLVGCGSSENMADQGAHYNPDDMAGGDGQQADGGVRPRRDGVRGPALDHR